MIHPPKGSTYFYNKNSGDVPSEKGWMKTDLCDPKDDISIVIEKERPSPPRRKWRSGGGVRWKRGGNKSSPQSERLLSLQEKLKKKNTSSATDLESTTMETATKPKRKWKPGSTVSWSRKKNNNSDENIRTLQSKRSARFQVTQSWKQRIEGAAPGEECCDRACSWLGPMVRQFSLTKKHTMGQGKESPSPLGLCMRGVLVGSA